LYFRNRWYSVEAGQWLTHDPLGEVDSVNLYAFNRFDSVNFVDPFGLKSDGAAPEAKCGNGRTTCVRDVGPWLKRELDEQNRIQERDSVAARQASAQAMATAVVGVIGATSGGIGTAGAARLPKHPLVVLPVVGIGVGVLACQAGVDAQCQSNLKGIEKEAVRLAEALRKEVIRELAAVIAVVAAAAEGEGGEADQSGPTPASPDEAKPEREVEQLPEFYDVDDAAKAAFGDKAVVVGPAMVDENGEDRVKNQEVRDKLEALGYNPDDFRAVNYPVEITVDEKLEIVRHEEMKVFEAGKGDDKVYVAPHPSSSPWK
jgi:hypothetical protein